MTTTNSGSCHMGVIVQWGSCPRGSYHQDSSPRGSNCPRTCKNVSVIMDNPRSEYIMEYEVERSDDVN